MLKSKTSGKVITNENGKVLRRVLKRIIMDTRDPSTGRIGFPDGSGHTRQPVEPPPDSDRSVVQPPTLERQYPEGYVKNEQSGEVLWEFFPIVVRNVDFDNLNPYSGVRRARVNVPSTTEELRFNVFRHFTTTTVYDDYVDTTSHVVPYDRNYSQIVIDPKYGKTGKFVFPKRPYYDDTYDDTMYYRINDNNTVDFVLVHRSEIGGHAIAIANTKTPGMDMTYGYSGNWTISETESNYPTQIKVAYKGTVDNVREALAGAKLEIQRSTLDTHRSIIIPQTIIHGLDKFFDGEFHAIDNQLKIKLETTELPNKYGYSGALVATIDKIYPGDFLVPSVRAGIVFPYSHVIPTLDDSRDYEFDLDVVNTYHGETYDDDGESIGVIHADKNIKSDLSLVKLKSTS